MTEISRNELIDAIATNVRKTGNDREAGKEPLNPQEKCECFEDILHCCDDATFETGDKELLREIKKDAERAIAIVKSDSPDKTDLVDCRKRIMNNVNRLKGR